ncbi:hypothetical protein OEZ86_010325 [Tetradesmus obliquus]|nr:hypothetical protein OEZ86_010325 [Tetradesmus obliquus]
MRSQTLAKLQDEREAVLCDYTLRKVLSFLEVQELLCAAALVSSHWRQASQCKEVWRRRMHKQVLELFSQGPLPGQPWLSPARLFRCLYQSNLLRNSSFLERENAVKLPGAPRQQAWEATHNARGMTWAHPFDFHPELSPLPAECGAAKPFSVGCLAVGPGGMLSFPGWSEVAQVCDLSAALAAAGLPSELSQQLLASGLTLELSVYVAGGAISGGEYQVATTLLSAADVAAAAAAAIPLAALPRMTLPFGHPPAGSAGVEQTAAANLKALGLSSSSLLAKAPLQPPPGEWMRYSCRMVLPKGAPVSHVVVALRGKASHNRRGLFATKFAAAHLGFVTADNC